MFEFQKAITGYKVVHDDVRVLATSQESKFLGGTRRQDLCRLQIWTSSPSKVDAPTETQRPYPASTFTALRQPSQTSFTTITTTQPRRRSSVFTLSTVSSGPKESTNSTSSSSSDPQAPPKSAVPVGGAAVFTPPVPPCIVLFAHKVPGRGEEEGASRYFLIIDVKPEVVVQEESIESEYTHDLSYQCVLESKDTYLPARRSPETSDPDRWDLAVAGIHKRQAGTGRVKRLKHVIMQFDSQNNLSQFITKFKQVQALGKLRLSQFLQATG